MRKMIDHHDGHSAHPHTDTLRKLLVNSLFVAFSKTPARPKASHPFLVSTAEEAGQLADKWKDKKWFSDEMGEYSGSYKALVVELDILH